MTKISKRITTINRLEYIKELLNDKIDIKKDKKVISWKISNRQIDRYIKTIKENNQELNKLLAAKNDTRLSIRIPAKLKNKLNEYYKDKANNTNQVEVIITALYEYLKKME